VQFGNDLARIELSRKTCDSPYATLLRFSFHPSSEDFTSRSTDTAVDLYVFSKQTFNRFQIDAPRKFRGRPRKHLNLCVEAHLACSRVSKPRCLVANRGGASLGHFIVRTSANFELGTQGKPRRRRSSCRGLQRHDTLVGPLCITFTVVTGNLKALYGFH
jgi:hypothetical protein